MLFRSRTTTAVTILRAGVKDNVIPQTAEAFINFRLLPGDTPEMVIDTITAGGKIDAPTPQRVFWCVFEGLVAIALLLGGGLGALQAMSVSTGFPFTIVLLLACVAIVKGLMSEPR
mgnify:CR=1 FL=1